MTTAKEIKKTLKGDKLNFENIENIMNELGYSIKFFNTSTGDIEIERYDLHEEKETLMSFTYYETARIVFIDGDLSAEDKMYLAIHELGHIALGHIGKGNINKRNRILMDIEADNFVYSIINKNTNSSLYMLISAIVLSVSSIIGACIYTITPTIQTISAPVTISQTSVTEMPKTSEAITEAVYVTPSGTRFHRQGCFYTKGKSLTKLQISEAEKKYIPCSRCNPRQ